MSATTTTTTETELPPEAELEYLPGKLISHVPDGRFAPEVVKIKQRIHAMFRQRREVL